MRINASILKVVLVVMLISCIWASEETLETPHSDPLPRSPLPPFSAEGTTEISAPKLIRSDNLTETWSSGAPSNLKAYMEHYLKVYEEYKKEDNFLPDLDMRMDTPFKAKGPVGNVPESSTEVVSDLAYNTNPYRYEGKLIFTTPRGRSVCSATVIGKNLLLSAGHCVYPGNGGAAYTNVLFIPGYRPGFQPGVFAAKSFTSFGSWVNNRDFRRDWALITLGPDLRGRYNKVSEYTGWAGVSAKPKVGDKITALGYPAERPWDGQKMIQTKTEIAYEIMSPPSNLVFYSRMNGGASGGGVFNYKNYIIGANSNDAGHRNQRLAFPYLDQVVFDWIVRGKERDQ